MHIFFSLHNDHGEILLDPEESRHAIRVLRLSHGDEVGVMNGHGNFFTATILTADPQKVRLQVTGEIRQKERAPYYLHLAIAPTKNMNRFEFFVEKATEIGVDETTPLLCDHSERNKIRPDRLRKIAVTALKQSQQLFLPILHPLTPFTDLLKRPFHGDRFIAHCCTHERAQQHLFEAISSPRLLILIGPEGDFSEDEVILARQEGYLPVSLGKSRLRTETAGIMAAMTAAIKHYPFTQKGN